MSVDKTYRNQHTALACGKTGRRKPSELCAKIVAGLRAPPSIARHVGIAETKSVVKLRKEVIARMTSSHSKRCCCHERWKKFMTIYVEVADTSHVSEKTRRVSGVVKKCRKRLRRDFQPLIRKNTYAECVKAWKTQRGAWRKTGAHK